MNWYAIYCRSQHEATVTDGLVSIGIEAYLPAYPATSRWSDRSQIIQKPLFPGYAFGRCYLRQIPEVAGVRGAVHVLGTPLDGPLAIPDAEIEAVRALLASGLPMQDAAFHEYQTGEKVEIATGPFAGQIGVISRKKKHRLIVAVSALQIAKSIEVDAECLRLVKQAAA